jgi:putative toxin-antitoxin system antitoxin component (TIGR02293 family)
MCQVSEILTNKAKGFRNRNALRSTPPAGRGKRSGGGVVRYYVDPLSAKTAAARFDPAKVVEALRAGLPVRELEDLQASLNLPMEKLVPKLGMSRATFHRRKATGKLDQAESDRVVRFARLMGKAVEVMESEEHARQWLASPQFGLGGAVPLDYAETETGAREVEDLLGRIEYGVYS